MEESHVTLNDYRKLIQLSKAAFLLKKSGDDFIAKTVLQKITDTILSDMLVYPNSTHINKTVTSTGGLVSLPEETVVQSEGKITPSEGTVTLSDGSVTPSDQPLEINFIASSLTHPFFNFDLPENYSASTPLEDDPFVTNFKFYVYTALIGTPRKLNSKGLSEFKEYQNRCLVERNYVGMLGLLKYSDIEYLLGTIDSENMTKKPSFLLNIIKEHYDANPSYLINVNSWGNVVRYSEYFLDSYQFMKVLLSNGNVDSFNLKYLERNSSYYFFDLIDFERNNPSVGSELRNKIATNKGEKSVKTQVKDGLYWFKGLGAVMNDKVLPYGRFSASDPRCPIQLFVCSRN